MAKQKKTVKRRYGVHLHLHAGASVRRAARKKYTAEEKVRIVLEGLRGDTTIAELCRKEGIQPNLYYKRSKEFLLYFK